MSTYVSLGSRYLVGVADVTMRNTGNWTISFDPSALNINMPYFEVSHIVCHGAAGTTFDIWIDLREWDANQNGYTNSWDPSIPLPLHPGETLYFFWSDTTQDGTPPNVTIWLRYDQDIAANKKVLLGMQ